MSQQKFSLFFGLLWALPASCVFAALLWSAPAPRPEAGQEEEAAEPVKTTEEEAAQYLTTSENNLRQIALAFHLFAAVENDHPPTDIEDKDGNKLLSWRVRLLPYLEQDRLYGEFNLDEAWDSESNKKLIEKMPDVLSSPRVVLKKKGFTVYQGFAGDGALFQTGAKINFPASIRDGTSNTIMAVESSVAVPWTKPVDLPFDAKKDLPDIGKAYDSKPLAALCDGSVRTLDLNVVAPKTLKAAITIAGDEILGPDW